MSSGALQRGGAPLCESPIAVTKPGEPAFQKPPGRPAGLTAYQRWELDSFDRPASTPRAAAPRVSPETAELERLREEARRSGHAAGYREGAALAAAEGARLAELVTAFGASLQEVDERLAGELLDLALAVANQVLRETLRLRPELVLAVIRQVLAELPRGTQRAHLALHPADAALVQAHLGQRLVQSGVQVIEDVAVRRGGCRVETPECDIDATLERRWQRVVSALGTEHGWIE